MNKSLVMTLMRKDWHLWKKPIFFFLLLGFAGLGVVVLGHTQYTFIIGGVLLITAIIILACVLVQAAVAAERKEQHLAFVMSLPVTAWEYSWAKIIFCLGTYFIAWALLVGAACYVVLGSPIPDGMMALLAPMFLALACPMVLMLAVAIVSESMQATVIIMTACNIGINFFLFSVVRIHDIASQLDSAAVVFTRPIYTLMGAELLFMAATIGLTLYVQCRKTDFI
jgi:ABC-type transport system involved in multi-copper enzyme maturation permease subunit